MNIDKHVAQLWKDDPVTCAYYIAGYLNESVNASIPSTVLCLDADFIDPDNDTGWRSLCLRPAWALDQDPVAKLHEAEAAIEVALSRWFLHHLRKLDLRKELGADEFASAIGSFGDAPDATAVFCAADVVDQLLGFGYAVCQDHAEPEARVFNQGEVFLSRYDVGYWAVDGVHIGVPEGIDLPDVPQIIESNGAKMLEIPFHMRFRWSIDGDAHFLYAAKS